MPRVKTDAMNGKIISEILIFAKKSFFFTELESADKINKYLWSIKGTFTAQNSFNTTLI